MPNEAVDGQEPGIQAAVDRFTDFVGDSIKNKAELTLKPVNEGSSEYLLISQGPDQESQTLVVNYATAEAVSDALDLGDLDRAEGLTQHQIKTQNISSLMAGRIMQKIAPTTTS